MTHESKKALVREQLATVRSTRMHRNVALALSDPSSTSVHERRAYMSWWLTCKSRAVISASLPSSGDYMQ